ncbi:MAG: universal stress protein [Acidobacteria bacterium]|nr:universal stress protein [Acidobacteriota bacterium]
MNWKTVLAPTDFSEHSRRGLWLARDIAREQSARLVVLHVVVDAVPALLPDVAGFRYDEIAESLAKRAQDMLPEFFPDSERAGVDVTFRLEFGVPHDEIVRVATEVPADLVCIATHGRTGAAHLLIGSVAEKVIRGCPCPVLVTK